jgi:hypothetical protein
MVPEQGPAEEEALKKGMAEKSREFTGSASFTPRRDFQVLFACDASAGN